MSAFKRVYTQNAGTAFEDTSSDLTTVPNRTVQLINAGRSTVGNAAPGDAIDTSEEVVTNGNDITAFDEVRLFFRDADIRDGLIDQSPVIPVSELVMSDLTYTAPAQQQTDVDIPAASADGFWSIKIVNVESGNQPFEYRTFEVEVSNGDSASTVAQAFADAINEAEDQINDYEGASVTANNNAGVLELTADDVGDIFKVATQGFEANSITTVTDPTEGVGTPEQVQRYEADDDGTLGRYVESTNLLGSIEGPATYADPSGQYDLLTFTFDGDSEKAVNKSIARQTYIVALESAVIGNATDAGGATGPDFAEFFAPVIEATDR